MHTVIRSNELIFMYYCWAYRNWPQTSFSLYKFIFCFPLLWLSDLAKFDKIIETQLNFVWKKYTSRTLFFLPYVIYSNSTLFAKFQEYWPKYRYICNRNIYEIVIFHTSKHWLNKYYNNDFPQIIVIFDY